jgi:hypothetical protein
MTKAFEYDRMSRCEMHYVGARRKMRLQQIIEKAGEKKGVPIPRVKEKRELNAS